MNSLFSMHYVLLFAFLISSFTTSAAEKLHFVTEELPPLHIVEDNRLTGGAVVDVIKEIIHRAELDATIELYPWARSYNLALTQPNTLIFSMRRNHIREPLFHWLGELYPVKSYFTSLKRKGAVTILAPEDFEKYRVGIVRGDFVEQQLILWGMNDAVYLSADHHQLWALLFSEKLDAVVSNDLSFHEGFNSGGYSINDVLLNQSPLFEDTALYLAANIDMPERLRLKISQTLKEIKQDGTYQKILEKYGIFDVALTEE